MVEVFAEETNPVWVPESQRAPSPFKADNHPGGNASRPTPFSRSLDDNQEFTPRRRTNAAHSVLCARLTLGYNRESQMVQDGAAKTREQLLKGAMRRRTKRAYKLAEQTCRFVDDKMPW